MIKKFAKEFLYITLESAEYNTLTKVSFLKREEWKRKREEEKRREEKEREEREKRAREESNSKYLFILKRINYYFIFKIIKNK